MSTAYRNFKILIPAFFVVVVCMAFNLGTPVLKIMPLGDSITEGTSQWTCYRYYLDNMLNDNGIAHDFVGSLAGSGSG